MNFSQTLFFVDTNRKKRKKRKKKKKRKNRTSQIFSNVQESNRSVEPSLHERSSFSPRKTLDAHQTRKKLKLRVKTTRHNGQQLRKFDDDEKAFEQNLTKLTNSTDSQMGLGGLGFVEHGTSRNGNKDQNKNETRKDYKNGKGSPKYGENIVEEDDVDDNEENDIEESDADG